MAKRGDKPGVRHDIEPDLTDAEIFAGVGAIKSGYSGGGKFIIPGPDWAKAANRVTRSAFSGPLHESRWPRPGVNRWAVLCAAIRVGYPVLQTDLLPGQWAHANGKVDAFRAEKRLFGIGGRA